jgi:class 3 adenylate cyclase/tetratricopeptide (TPR) repeat protein
MRVHTRDLAAFLPEPVIRAVVDSSGLGLPRSIPGPGTILFADVSGFTAMTEALASRGHEGGEALTRILNGFFSRVLEGHREAGGSALRFLGDAMVLLFPEAEGEGPEESLRRALAVAVRMQVRIAEFCAVTALGMTFELRMKVGVGTGGIDLHLLGETGLAADYLVAGPALAEAVAAEHRADKGEIRLGPGAACLAGLAGGGTPWPTSAELPPVRPLAVEIPSGEEVERNWDALALLLPPAVAARIREGLSGMGAEIRPVTTAFVAFAGLPPPADSDFLPAVQRYYVAAARIVERFGGRLNRIDAGDKGNVLHLLFGAPEAHEDDEERGVAAAKAFVEELPRATDLPLVHSIGVNTGRVYCGALGAADRHEYTVMGDSVNLAARLMQAAGPGEILFSSGTAAGLRRRLAAVPLPPIRVKGKSGLIELFRPVERTAVPSAERDRVPFVGRRNERSRLRSALSRVVSGRGRVVSLVGEAGIGKSRLIEEAVTEAARRGFAIHRTECRSEGRGAPFQPLVGLFRELLGVPPGELPRPELLRSRIGPLRPGGGGEELLGPLLGSLGATEEPMAATDAAARRSRLFDLAADLLRRSSREAPFLLVVEDAHWIDPASRELLAHVGRRIADAAVLLVAVGREGSEPEGWVSLAHRLRIPLGPLAPRELETIAAQRLGVRRLPRSLSSRLAERSHGNPHFLGQLIVSLGERKALAGGLDRVSGSMLDAALADLPDTLQGILQSRLDRLPETLKGILRVAAVAGKSFPAELIERVAPFEISGEALERGLERLAEESLVERREGGTWSFPQGLVQEVAYEGLLFETRRALHRRIARSLEADAGERAEEIAERLAHHYSSAREVEPGARWLEIAGDRAAGAAALDLAAGHYRQALELLGAGGEPERAGRLSRKAAEQLVRLGRGRESEEEAERFLRLAEAGGSDETRAGAWLLLFEAQVLVSRYEEAIETGRRGLALSEGLARPDLVAEFHETFAICMTKLGRPKEALRSAKMALASAREGRDDRRSAEAAIDLANSLLLLGEAEEALMLARDAFDRFVKLGLPDRRLVALTVLATSLERLGRTEEMMSTYREAVELCRSNGLRGYTSATLLEGYGCSRLRRGENAEAAALLGEALDLWREVGSDYGVANCLSNLGVVEQLAGRWKKATALHEEALAYRRRTGERDNQIVSLGNLGEIAMERGREDEAERDFSEALVIAAEVGDEATRGMLLRLLAEIALGKGDLRGFIGRMRDGLPIAEKLGMKDEVSSFVRLSALLRWKAGHFEAAASDFSESLRLAREAGSPLHEVQCLRDWGSSALGREPEAARERLANALSIARRSGLAKEAREIARRLKRGAGSPIGMV